MVEQRPRFASLTWNGLMLLDRFDRIALAHLPTPLERMPRLSRALGSGPQLWVKRDDCTGLATGGNKARKLEYLLAEALRLESTCIVTAGELQSNHVRQTAAAAARLGLGCEIVLESAAPDADQDFLHNGNVLIDRILGAGIRTVPRGADTMAAAETLADSLRAAGERPYVVPVGGSNALGALGYARCAEEIVQQAREAGVALDLVVHATGSAGTQAGLVAGFAALGEDIPVLGICVSRAALAQEAKVRRLGREIFDLLGVDAGFPDDRVRANGDYVGEGFGIPTDGMIAAVELTARNEGLLLDPAYTGKAMAGLMDLVRKGDIDPNENVLFVHTGGEATLFAYRATFEAGVSRLP